MKKLLLTTVLLLSLTAANAQNVTFHGNVINGFWYQNNDNRDWTTWLIGMYTFTDQKQTWAYDITREHDSETMMMTYSSPNIEITNPALYGGQGAIRVDNYFYTFFGREKDNDDDPGNIGGEYGSETMEVVVRKWDINTWELLDTQVYPPSRNLNFVDLTYDPSDDVVYCIYSDLSESENSAISTYYLGTLDIETMTVSRISSKALGVEFRTLAANPNGKLYAIAYGGRTAAQDQSFPGTLYSIDKKTGEYEAVGEIGHGIPRTAMQSSVCDWRTGKLYHAGNMYNSDVEKSTREKSVKETGLYEIDITTGKSTLISKFPYKETIVGLWIEGDYEKKTRDLNISFQTPRQLQVGQKSSVIATVKNLGSAVSQSFNVVLTANGKTVQTISDTELQPGETASYTFEYTPSVADGSSVTFQATVDYAADENKDNNTTESVTVNLLQSTLPSVELEGKMEGNSVHLIWDDPVMEIVTEDFERYTPFIISNLGDWTTLQLGGKEATATLNSWEGTYNYANAGAPFAYQVFNPAEAGFDSYYYEADTCTYYCQSGSQMLLSVVGAKRSSNAQGYEYVVSNDWLISPELSGRKQTIKFYAKGWTSQVKDMFGSYRHYTEFFNVLYSMTDNNPESFIKIGDTNVAPMWFSDGAFEFELPAGAKYFAIQCVSDPEGTVPEGLNEDDYDYVNNEGEGFMFFLDDIMYTPAPANHIGYNIYKNGERLNSELIPVTTLEYIDTDGQGETNNVYAVTAVYTEGESPLSNTYTVVGTSIDNIEIAKSHKLNGVYTTSGQYLGRLVPHQKGMYIVHRDGQSHKVLVR